MLLGSIGAMGETVVLGWLTLELTNSPLVVGIAMRAGWLVGSLGAGAVIARFGSGAAYLAVAAGFLAGAAALLATSSPTRATRAQPESFWRSVIGFASSMRTDRSLVVLMLLTAGAEMLGFSHQALLPSLARDVLRTGPEGLGTPNAARAVGGILGLTVASMRGPVAGGGALFVTVLLSCGGSLHALGLTPYDVHFTGVVVVLVVVNALRALADLLAQSLLQLSAPAHLRGPAGGAWVVAIGLAPLGQLPIGALATMFGVSVAFGASGLALVALAGATALLFPRLRRL